MRQAMNPVRDAKLSGVCTFAALSLVFPVLPMQLSFINPKSPLLLWLHLLTLYVTERVALLRGPALSTVEVVRMIYFLSPWNTNAASPK
jgi:hypothetical protein